MDQLKTLDRFVEFAAQLVVLVLIGFVLSALTGWVLHGFDVQGYPWDNLTIQALLYAILIRMLIGPPTRR